MTFVEAAKAPLLNYADFSGRSGRREFWSFSLAVSIALGCLIGLAFVALEIAEYASGFPAVTVALAVVAVVFIALYLLVLVMLITPWVAVCVRRLHDTNRGGDWLLVAFVPFGGLVVLSFLAAAGDSGPNDYGPNPSAPATTSRAAPDARAGQ